MKKIKTAEKISNDNYSNNPIFLRSKLAYEYASQYCIGTTLELGTGSGYGLQIIAEKSNLLLTIDKDLVSYKKFTDKLKNIFFIKHKVPLLYGIPDESIDTIVCLQFIEHIYDDKKLISEIIRVLKKGGICIISTPNKQKSLSRNPYHFREYSSNELLALFSDCTFTNIEIFGVNGNDRVSAYYSENKKSVEKFQRYDVFNFEKWLPSFALKMPYEILNQINRNKLYKENFNLLNNMQLSDFFINNELTESYDFIIKITK